MRISNILLLLAFLLVSSISSADTASEKQAERLLETMNVDQAFEQTITQMLDIQLQQNPKNGTQLFPYPKNGAQLFP